MESPKKRGRPKKDDATAKAVARRRQRSAKRKGVSKSVGRPKKTSTQTQTQTQIVNVKVGDTAKKTTRRASGKSSGTPPASYQHNLAPIFIQPSPQPDYTELFKALQNNQSIQPPMETIRENTPLSTSVSQGIQTSNPLSLGVSQAVQTSSKLSVKSEPARAKPSFVPNNFIPKDFLGRRIEDDEVSELSMDESGIIMDEPFSVKSEPLPFDTQPPPLIRSVSDPISSAPRPRPKPSKRRPFTQQDLDDEVMYKELLRRNQDITFLNDMVSQSSLENKEEFQEEFKSPLEPFGSTTGSIKGDDNTLEYDSSVSSIPISKASSSKASITSQSVDDIFSKSPSVKQLEKEVPVKKSKRAEEEESISSATSTIASRISPSQVVELTAKSPKPLTESSAKAKKEQSAMRMTFDKLQKEKKLHQLSSDDLYFIVVGAGNKKRVDALKKYYDENKEKRGKGYELFSTLLNQKATGTLPIVPSKGGRPKGIFTPTSTFV